MQTIKRRSNHPELSCSEMTQYITEYFKISENYLVGALEITSRTLNLWKKEWPNSMSGKVARLVTLYNYVQLAREYNIDGKKAFSLLTQPVDDNDESSPILFYYIVEEPNNRLLKKLFELILKK